MQGNYSAKTAKAYHNKTRTPGYARPPLLVGVGKEGPTDRPTDRQTDKAFCRPTPWVWQLMNTLKLLR